MKNSKDKKTFLKFSKIWRGNSKISYLDWNHYFCWKKKI